MKNQKGLVPLQIQYYFFLFLKNLRRSRPMLLLRKIISRNDTFVTGFTLLELLTVISIISFMANIAFATVSIANMKARDAKRIADLRQVRTALELYYNDHREYPHRDGYGTHSGNSPGNWIPELVNEGYMPALPNDPKNVGNQPYFNGENYTYLYSSFAADNYQDYNLIAKLENPNHPERCELRCWKFNSDNASPSRKGHSWCEGTVPACDDGINPTPSFSSMLYSNH